MSTACVKMREREKMEDGPLGEAVKEKKKKKRAEIKSQEQNGLLSDHNTSEGVLPRLETASNCSEHLGSHRASAHC